MGKWNCLYTTASDEALMETMFSCPIRNPNSSKQILEVKEMTSKKTKPNDLKIITNFDYRTKEVKKKNQNTKRIETFFPVSNEEAPKK
jgi:hypothetical protein